MGQQDEKKDVTDRTSRFRPEIPEPDDDINPHAKGVMLKKDSECILRKDLSSYFFSHKTDRISHLSCLESLDGLRRLPKCMNVRII